MKCTRIKSNASCVHRRLPTLLVTLALLNAPFLLTDAKLADRGRVVKARKERTKSSILMNSRVYGTNTIPSRELPVGVEDLPIEGPKYRGQQRWNAEASNQLRNFHEFEKTRDEKNADMTTDEFERELASQLTGCCSNWNTYSADNLCYKYGNNCASGSQASHDSGDGDCGMEGLSFIGVSFSVNTASGNPMSYMLCDQFAMENIIDRDYEYVMSMDEDGWLVGGGYKSFDYSGKMPYIDSSHTELIRIGALDAEYGGTTIDQVYAAMSSVSFSPFAIFPEYVKGGGKGGSGDDDDDVPSGDVTLVVSVVQEFEDNSNYSLYEQFLDSIFSAMDAVNGGPCMDDHDTDPHVSMSRGVKFKSSYHQQQYFYSANLEVAVWQSMYPSGVVIGSNNKANFPPENATKNRKYVGYGNLYFFFDRANITKAFPANRDLYNSESYYSTLTQKDTSAFYASTTKISFSYQSGSKDNNQYYEHNPYAWNAKMAMHDMTDGWSLPPNCNQEGETFLGIPLSRKSGSKLQTTSTFQNQFDFESLVDRNFTYMKSFGTNHGWLVGEELNNGPGSIVDKDTSHIPIFYSGTTNPNMGGLSLSNLIKVLKNLNFGTLYIKPAFLFQDEDGAVKLQFEADANSALGYLYDNLCKMLGLTWNYETPSNSYGLYTNCAMHAAGDRATYGCGPDNANSGGFCPQMTVAYRVAFQSDDHAAAFFARGNNYVDYWRSLYPSGVAVGTNNFCKDGGCLGLFLNRYDLYQVFKPDLGGSWVEYNGATSAPTMSPAPTFAGKCKDSRNSHLDMCFKKQHSAKATAVAWNSLGPVGQLSVYLVSFMAVTLSLSIFLARARKKRRRGESYVSFLVRDIRKRGGGGRRKKGEKKKKKRRTKNKDLEEDMLGGGRPPKSSRSRSKSKSRSKSRSRHAEGSSSMHEGSSSRHRSSSKLREEEGGKSRSSRPREEEGGKSRSSRSREEDGGKRSSSRVRSSSKPRSSSKSRSSSKPPSTSSRRDEGGNHRSSRSSSRKKSGRSEEERSSSRSGRPRSRSRSRREGGSSSAKPDEDTMSRRQLV